MTLPVNSQSVELDLPLLGVDTNTSIVKLPAQFSPEMLNFNSEGGYVKTRNGVRLHSSISGYKEVCSLFSYLDATGVEKLVGTARNSSGEMTLCDFTSGTATLISAITTDTAYDRNPVWIYVNNYLYVYHNKSIFAGVGSLLFTNIAVGTWGAIGGFSTGGTLPFGGCNYKGRTYILGENSTECYYSEPGAVSGTMTTLNLSQFLSTSARLRAIIPFSLSDGGGSDELLAFVFSSGEVLVYAGQYPADPAWGKVGTFRIPNIVDIGKWIPVQGDAYIMTVAGLVSMRSLFLQGVDAANVTTLSYNVDRDWKAAYQGVTEGSSQRIHSSIAYSVDRRKIYCYLGTSANTKSYVYVYDALTQGWFTHQLPQLSANSGQNVYTPRSMCIHKGSLFIAGNDGKVWEYEKASTYSDENYASVNNSVGFSGLIKTAPIIISGVNANKKVGGVVTIAGGNVNKLKASLIANFGQKTSGESTQNTTNTGIQELYYSVGVEGKHQQIQYSISNSDVLTTDLKIYSQGVCFEQGGQR